MQGKIVMAAIVVILALGLIGAVPGHAAHKHFKSHSPAAQPTVKDPGHSRSDGNSPGTARFASKTKHGKKKTRMHASDRTGTRRAMKAARASRSSAGLEDLVIRIQPAVLPYDLWLAKEMPDAYRSLTENSLLKRLRLSIVDSAYTYVGTPYLYGGTTPDGFDCSGFVKFVYEENGISLGRTSREQSREGTSVSLSDLRPGDLIFFNMNRHNRLPIDHVGLYMGNGRFIHAPSKQSRSITIENLHNVRYLPKVVEARRVLEYPESTTPQ